MTNEFSVYHEAHHLTSDQESEQIAASSWLNPVHVRQTYNLQNRTATIYDAHVTTLKRIYIGSCMGKLYNSEQNSKS